MRRAAVIAAAIVAAVALRVWQLESPAMPPSAKTEGERRMERPDVPAVAPEPLADERPAQRSNEDDGSYEARLAFHERPRTNGLGVDVSKSPEMQESSPRFAVPVSAPRSPR